MTETAPGQRAVGLGSSSEERRAFAVVHARMFRRRPVPHRLGRYFLCDRLGEGGMGTVHRAIDPELDREVAIKVVRGAAVRDADQRRLLEEARALARLTHPNVVPIFDVGLEDGRLYVAMELVHGATFGEWWRASARTSAEIVTVLAGVCAGLAAAHHQGIVHRDVKPSNVLIDRTGRPMLADFGLVALRDAQTVSERDDADAEESGSGQRSSRSLVVEGTPLYMAPEQHLGALANPAADQYSLCVIAVEALCRRHPFADVAGENLARVKLRPPSRTPPHGVPARLWSVLRRGLDPDPRKRWPDVEALAAAMITPPRARTRAAIVAVGFVGALGLAATVDRGEPDPCDADTSADAVWSDAQRRAARAAFAAAGDAGAEAWLRVDGRLSEFDERWSDGHAQACASDPSARADRLACLQRQRARARAFATALTDADAGAITHAPTAAWEATRLAACDDAAEPTSSRRPEDPRLATAFALRDLSRTRDGIALVTEILDSTGAGQSELRAAALQLRAELDLDAGRVDLAERDFDDAFRVATVAGLERRAYAVALSIVLMHADHRKDPHDARKWLRHAEAAAIRGGIASDEPALVRAQASVQLAEGEFADALAGFERLIELDVADEDPRNLAVALHDSALALAKLGRNREAAERLRRALDVWTQIAGPANARVAETRENLAIVLAAAGDVDEAIAEHRLVIDELTGLPQPPLRSLAMTLGNLGAALTQAGRVDEAIVQLQTAVAILLELGGGDDIMAAELRINLAIALDDAGRFEDALREDTAALEVFRARLGDADYRTALTQLNRANVLFALGRAEALPAAREAVRGIEVAVGDDRTDRAVAIAHVNLGKAELRYGDREAGFRAFDRAFLLAARLDENRESTTKVIADEIEALLADDPSREARELRAREH